MTENVEDEPPVHPNENVTDESSIGGPKIVQVSYGQAARAAIGNVRFGKHVQKLPELPTIAEENENESE